MCVDCFNDCGTSLTSDKCVKYTGENIESLNICNSDPLSVVEGAIINKLISITAGEGISVTGITGCNSVVSLFDSISTLKSILQSFSTNICANKSSITSLQSAVNQSYSFDIGCLSTLTSTSTRDQVIQATVYKVCSNSSAILTIQNDYVKASELNTLVENYIQSTVDSNTSTVVNNYSLAIPYVAYEYYGPLTNFDATGKGLASAGFDKMYICNGQNGTPDKRGRVAVGAIAGVPGGSLDTAVDPALPANTGKNYALKDKFGASSISLSIANLPSHTHPVNDPKHSHKLIPDAGSQQVARSGGGTALRLENYGASATTTLSATGITIGSTGNNTPHDNVQPSIAAYFIMYIP